MKDITEVSELNEWLSDLPETIKYKDGDTIMEFCLNFYFRKSNHKWVAAYTCDDCHLMCGYGNTLVKAVNHLRRILKCYNKYKDEGYVQQ